MLGSGSQLPCVQWWLEQNREMEQCRADVGSAIGQGSEAVLQQCQLRPLGTGLVCICIMW